MATTVFLVIDNVDTANDIVKTWLFMLLSAEAIGVRIRFHANDLGVNSRGFQDLIPSLVIDSVIITRVQLIT